MSIKVLSVKTVGHNKDNMKNGGGMHIQVKKNDNGEYQAEIMGQNITATDIDMQMAITKAKDIFKEQFGKGDQKPRSIV